MQGPLCPYAFLATCFSRFGSLLPLINIKCSKRLFNFRKRSLIGRRPMCQTVDSQANILDTPTDSLSSKTESRLSTPFVESIPPRMYVGNCPSITQVILGDPGQRVLAYRSFDLFLGNCKCFQTDFTPSLCPNASRILEGSFLTFILEGIKFAKAICFKNFFRLRKNIIF